MVNLIDNSTGPLPARKVKVPEPPKAGGRTPVSVNGVEIAGDTIREEAQLHPAENPGEAISEATRALVVRELLLQEAAAKNIIAAPQTLGEGLRETEADAAIRELLDREVVSPGADEKACQRYYETNPAKFCSQTIYEARHILFAAPLSDPAARQAAKCKAETVLKNLADNPDSFAELALAHSACPSKEQGGNLGQLSKGSTVPEFETILFALEAGQTSPTPVPTRFGYHIIRLERIIEGEQLP
ncbi:MAG TPA: peptidylprolyl isomerase, partial [Devosia sp.]|nr:peptidylprolyl isomerase [Devosia sp.]